MCLFFETAFLCVVLAILELALCTRLALIYLPLPLECTDWIKGVCLKKLCFNINFHMAKWQIQGISKYFYSVQKQHYSKSNLDVKRFLQIFICRLLKIRESTALLVEPGPCLEQCPVTR